MKRSVLIAFLFFITSAAIYSQQSNTGVGIILGEPTGLNTKLWLDDHNALVGGIGWHFAGADDGFSMHLDYLYHIDNKFSTTLTFPLYYGFGARIRNEGGDFGLGFRGVGGILFYLDPEPIDFFIEFAPVFRLFPNTDLEFDAAIGGRYYF